MVRAHTDHADKQCDASNYDCTLGSHRTILHAMSSTLTRRVTSSDIQYCGALHDVDRRHTNATFTDCGRSFSLATEVLSTVQNRVRRRSKPELSQRTGRF